MKKLKTKILILTSALLLGFSVTGFFLASYIIPENITITKEQSNGKWIPKEISWFVSSKEAPTYPAMENMAESSKGANNTYPEKVYFCGVVPIKTVEVAIIDTMSLIPGGESIGINLKTQGILVVGFAEFSSDGKKISPAKNAGVREGDIFTKINGQKIDKAGEFSELIKTSDGTISLEGIRGGKPETWDISPVTDDSDGEKKIGLWIRESIAGVGTVSFYINNKFGALGHSITDIDTGDEVSGSGGNICQSKIVSIEKGSKGSPGSMVGVFSGDNIGEIKLNTDCGLYGEISNVPDTSPVKPASKSEVRPGKATIRCDIGSGKVESFDVEIIRITSMGNNSKNMIIKVTDKKLLSKTGGIVQGMSGAPLIQNGKLVGAVTHVFVNDPTRGYAIFIENMLEEANKIK